MGMLNIPTGEAAIVFFAEKLNAIRPLEDLEVRALHLAIQRDRGSFRRWTEDEDRRLLKMHKARIQGAQMAATLRRSEDSIYSRLRILKKKEKTRGR